MRVSTAPIPDKYIICSTTFRPVKMKYYLGQDIYMLDQFDTVEEAKLSVSQRIIDARRSLEIAAEKANRAIIALNRLEESL